MTVKELLSRVDARELAEWQAFYLLEPWGTKADMLPAGIIVSEVANMLRPKGRQPYRADEFLPEFGPKSPQTVASMKAEFKQLFNARKALTDGDHRSG